MVTSRKNAPRKRTDLFQFVIGITIVILLNYVGQFVFERFDLTQEKRYSLTEATETRLGELNDIIYLKIYLTGDLPANFKRLENATRELLDEFRAYAGDNIQYEFVDPSENPNQEIRNSIYQELSDKGLQYTNIRVNEGDKRSEQIIFPGALVTMGDKELPLQLLKSKIGTAPEVMLNISIQQLEYELMSAIKKISTNDKKRIAVLEGHGEFDPMQIAAAKEALREFYVVEDVSINGQLDALKFYDALLIAGPDSAFSEKDKYMIDQFIMNGGKSMWFIDPVVASMDSIRKKGITLGVPKDLNLTDQLFKYGARINQDLILDLQALPIPIVTGMIGNQPKQEFYPWYYYPLITSRDNHPIVKNIDAVMTRFVSSIDTVGSSKVKKTPLLISSSYSKVSNTPHRISLNVLRDQPDERQYKNGNKIAAVLLEGKFESVFKNRLGPKVTQNPDFRFKESSKPTKMIIVSDADIIRNDVNRNTKEFYALGYDRYTQRTYGNLEFVANAMNYLLEEDGLIQARSKEFQIRLLDKQRIEKERSRWQIFNIATPIILILLVGFTHAFIRKRKYARRKAA